MEPYPKDFKEVIDGLNSYNLFDGDHVEFKVYKATINYDSITRSMVAMSNTGGGAIIIGVGALSHNAYIMHGLPDGIKHHLEVDLPIFIETHTVNLDNWTFEIGVFDSMDIAAVFVQPSQKGFSFFHSETDIAKRSYYYRSGGKNIGVRSQFKTVYKYMTLEAAIASLESGTWRFCEPTKWSDKYESRFYCADYSKISRWPSSEQRVYANCVTRTKNSNAAWKVYAGKEGMQSHCIQIEMDWVEMIQQLFATGYKIYERKVDYRDENIIMHLHEVSNKHYGDYFSVFDFNRFLDLLALQRDAYTYENEIRYFAVPTVPATRSFRKGEHKDLKIDWSKVINRIRIDKKCSDSELVALRYSCCSCGINLLINGRKLPGKAPAGSSSMKQVEGILFNIDDMPGKKHIIIQA